MSEIFCNEIVKKWTG